MTKKNYIAITEIVKNSIWQNTQRKNDLAPLIAITHDIAAYMASDNPRFNYDKFIKACNVEK